MQFFKAFFALVVLFPAICLHGASAQNRAVAQFGPHGAEGAEGQPNRRQQWLVPSPDPDIAAHALLFRPRARAVSAGADRARFHPERTAPGANAAARIRRVGRAGWSRRAMPCWCRNGRAMARPAESISRIRAAATTPTIPAPAMRPRIRSRRRLAYLLTARFYPARRRGRRRALRRRLGRAGAGERRPQGHRGDYCLRAGSRRPCQRCAGPGLRAAGAGRIGGRVRRGCPGAGDLAGRGQ